MWTYIILNDVLVPSVRATALPHPDPIYLVQDNYTRRELPTNGSKMIQKSSKSSDQLVRQIKTHRESIGACDERVGPEKL